MGTEDNDGVLHSLDEGGGLVEIVCLDDGLTANGDIMQFLEQAGLIPGRWAQVLRRTSNGVHVIGARANAIVPHDIAKKTWVRRVRADRD